MVEHVINNSGVSSQYHAKLRPFSGKIPFPYVDSDYDTWRSNVEFHYTDTFFSDNHTVRKIVESLHLHIVTASGLTLLPMTILAFSTQRIALAMMAMIFLQNFYSGEKPSDYLQRLQSTLSEIINCLNSFLTNYLCGLELKLTHPNSVSLPSFILLRRSITTYLFHTKIPTL